MTNLLLNNQVVVFSTREFALSQKLSWPAASHRLGRLAVRGDVSRLTRGIWTKPHHLYFCPAACVGHLLQNEQGYVSFLLALYQHGMISQIPARIQVATTGHARTLQTAVGTFEFFQINPRLMSLGVTWSHSHIPYRIASPEKALFDTLYLGTRKQKKFASLPEIDLAELDPKRFEAMLRSLLREGPIQTAMRQRWNRLKVA